MPGKRPSLPESVPAGARLLETGPGLTGLRVDKALADAYPDLSRSRINGLIQEGAVLVNGQAPKASARLRAGDVVEVVVPAPLPSNLEPEHGDLEILFEDPSLMVIAKPAGMVVHPGAGRPRGTLAAILLDHCGTLSEIGGVLRPGIVHRLDKGTSGVMVVAKNDAAHRSLSAQFKARVVTKIYSAICIGIPRPPRGSVHAPLGRDPRHRQRMAVAPEGRAAHTDYEVVESLGSASVLRLILHTGRTHQIRVHMASLNCPLVGDTLYGAAARASQSPPEARALFLAFPRPALHAQILRFEHPITGKPLRFEQPWPADLESLRRGLRSASASGGQRKIRK